MNRRSSYSASREATVRWILFRICVVEALLIVGLVLDVTSHLSGIR